MRSHLILTTGGTLALFFASLFLSAQPSPMLFRNPDAPIEERVQDLVSRLTLEEKISQMMSDAAPISRLGIPRYNWWNECLHGVARAGRATVFPEPVGLAAMWDTPFLKKIAEAISDEGRAKYNEFQRRGKKGIYQGLTFWTPNINIFRDPRWGRGMETYGEDPFLTSRLGVAFIEGLQGSDPKYLKTVATAKHYAVHSGPESQRHTFDVRPSDTDLLQTYLPHFEAAIREAHAESVMCAYNAVDGLPACADPKLLQEILRADWKFHGYIVSDCGAVGDIYRNHKAAADEASGVAMAVRAGTDLDCGTEYVHLLDAVHQGLITEKDIDQSVSRLFRARFRLGMFDPPSRVPFSRIPYSVNESPEHAALAREAARKSIVLLKNEGNLLPLAGVRTLAVIGPDADDLDVLLGNYNGEPSSYVTVLSGIRKKAAQRKIRVISARGSEVAEGLPHFEVIPSTALASTAETGRKPGLYGEYFNSQAFNGKQHRPAELTFPSSGKLVGKVPENLNPVFARIDPVVDFQWRENAPRRGMNEDDFGVRWSGFVTAPETGDYQIGASGLNGFDLYFDNQRVVSSQNIHERSFQYAAVHMEAGKAYAIRLEYFEYMGEAEIQLLWARPPKDLLTDALNAAKAADAVVLVMGLSPRLEGEEMKVPVKGFSGGDRLSLDLPQAQQDLMEKVAGTGKPVVLVLMNGSALAVNWAKEHVRAILDLWYPGQAGGDAVADVLFGDYNPGGRLPVTFYRSVDQLPPFTDYSMKERTYRYFHGDALFPFGYGLSYTSFEYRNLKIPPESPIGSPVKGSVDVTNTGSRAGEEVVEVYVRSSAARSEDPIHQLRAFERVPLKPGETKSVSFELHEPAFATVEGARRVVNPGEFVVFAGGQQPVSTTTAGRTQRDAGVLSTRIRLTGSPK